MENGTFPLANFLQLLALLPYFAIRIVAVLTSGEGSTKVKYENK